MTSLSQNAPTTSSSSTARPPTTATPIPAQQGQYAEYTLSSLRPSTSTRNHVMKLHAPRPVDPLTPTGSWTHPLKLHRRDPNAPVPRPEDILDQKGIKREVDVSVIAPYGGAQKAEKSRFKPKTKQVFHADKAEIQLRNEERTPWVLEDFDGKNTWVGTMEGGGASGYALFLFEKEGFKFVPVDRTYRFTKKGINQVLTAEEAEAQMKKRNAPLPRWILKDKPATPPIEGGGRRKMFMGTQDRERVVDTFEEDLDYDATERFEDDEENPILEGDEEANKAVEERVRQEMRRARNFESKEDEAEADIDLDDLFGGKKVTKEGKRTKRYLKRLEGKGDYETDEEEENPYASEVSPPSKLIPTFRENGSNACAGRNRLRSGIPKGNRRKR